VRQVIEAATYAPSAKNGQQWRFTVFTGKSKKELTDVFRRALEKTSRRIGQANMVSSFSSCSIMEHAPVVIIVWNAGDKGWETEIHRVAAAIQNMLLKAYARALQRTFARAGKRIKQALAKYGSAAAPYLFIIGKK
jgi:nitroreductase